MYTKLALAAALLGAADAQVSIVQGKISQDNQAYRMLTWDFNQDSTDSPELFDGDLC